MPGLIRKLVIYATIDGLIIQPHGHYKDKPAALRLDYKSHIPLPWKPATNEVYGKNPYLEAHGIIGLLNIAPLSFLIAITQREQVAQIFGKPIYVITGVALLPLSCQQEATTAIEEANATVEKSKASGSSETGTDDGSDGNESPVEHQPMEPADESSSTDVVEASARETNDRSIVRDVMGRKGQYGRFASQWFSRRGWGLGSKRPEALSAKSDQTPSEKHDRIGSGEVHSFNEMETASLEPVEKIDKASTGSNIAGKTKKGESERTTMDDTRKDGTEMAGSAAESTAGLLPKVLRSTKMILNSHSFYFSYEFNLTTRLGGPGDGEPPTREFLGPLYFWNRHLASPFSIAGHPSFVMPIVQGFVGQTPFTVKSTKKENSQTEASESSEKVTTAGNYNASSDRPEAGTEHSRSFLLTLISRRSTRRAGLRYLRRGIDDNGNCANTVETEQIVSSPTWDDTVPIRSFVQLRGSIPLYFSQSPFSFKPVPVLHQPPAVNQAAFERHFENLQMRYGSVQIALLVDKHGGESKIGEEYEAATRRFNESGRSHELGVEWFDFHAECRGMKFENVDRLVQSLRDTITAHGETVFENKTIKTHQSGIIRTNCMDCLDRTNVAQSAFAQYILQKAIEGAGFQVDFLHDPSTQWFNTLWADNGDAISRQYSSTPALKGDYTRTRKRNYRGALNDLGLTLGRYYNNTINDYFSQAVIDVLLGNVSTRVFDDFEATMMSADPGISVHKLREAAIGNCLKIVIQDAKEDFIHGWTMLSPAQPNTLRTLPFEESIVLLTDAALYGCKFDWDTEKIASFEKIDLRCITSIHVGTYVTSTLTEKQSDERLNVGIVISYAPDKESIIRVNIRSVHHAVHISDPKDSDNVETASGFTSWFGGGSRTPRPSRIMALKLIPSVNGEANDAPIAVAEQISQEIQRAIKGGIGSVEEREQDLIEKVDIISPAEARKRTGYLEQLGHSIKRLVWV